MARERMSWDWIGTKEEPTQIKCTVYTTFVHGDTYKVRIMLGDDNSPQSKHYRTGTVSRCRSHAQAVEVAMKWVAEQNGKTSLSEYLNNL